MRNRQKCDFDKILYLFFFLFNLTQKKNCGIKGLRVGKNWLWFEKKTSILFFCTISGNITEKWIFFWFQFFFFVFPYINRFSVADIKPIINNRLYTIFLLFFLLYGFFLVCMYMYICVVDSVVNVMRKDFNVNLTKFIKPKKKLKC